MLRVKSQLQNVAARSFSMSKIEKTLNTVCSSNPTTMFKVVNSTGQRMVINPVTDEGTTGSFKMSDGYDGLLLSSLGYVNLNAVNAGTIVSFNDKKSAIVSCVSTKNRKY